MTGFLTIDALLSGEKGAFSSAVSHLILPTIVLGTNPLAIIARMTRSAMLEVLGEDYIRTARAKGLSQLRVVALHAFRNALIPVITVIGLQVGVLFTGAILTETIFSWPGVGKWLIEAINRRDYPVLQGGLLMLGGIVMIVNLLVDVAYGVINPRIRRTPMRPNRSPPRRHRRPRRPGRCASSGVTSARNHGAVLGLVVVIAVLLDGGVRQRARALPAGPHQQRRLPAAAGRGRTAARRAYLLGTDAIGRDILSRLIYGARLSLLIGIAVVALSIVVGIALGLIAGFARGMTEIAIMRLMDIILTLPSLLLAIVIVAILGPGIMNAMLAVAVVVLPHYVRITRAAVIIGDVEGLRHRGARERRGPAAAHVQRGPAQLRGAADRAGLARRLRRDPRRRGAGLPRPGRAAARVRVGNDAGRRARIRAARVVGRHVSGRDDPGHRARVQPAGRRAARRARSEAQAMTYRSPWPLLEIEDLHVEFPSQGAVMRAVEGVSLSLDEGEVLGIVGESGSGKSVTMLAVMGLVAFPGPRARQAPAVRRARSPAACPTAERRALVGKDVAMIFQDPTTSLNPCFTIGFQLGETLRLHLGLDRKAARRARDRIARAGRHPGRVEPARRLSAPALGRHEPARDDRDGHRLQSATADRRRADDRARRDHPGADPRSAARPAEASAAWR